jgi:hypothetical protein
MEPVPEPKKQRVTWIPRPPESASRSTADFIVTIFAVTVASILIILTIGTVWAGVRGRDIASYFAIITSIVTSMISALVGFLAGKGLGKSEQPPIVQIESESPPQP